MSLGYQVAWFRIFTDRFGSTNLTFALVVCNFIGGLGLGALASRRVEAALARLGLGDRLRIYGAVEAIVGATALATLLTPWIPADLWGAFPYELRDGVYAPVRGLQLFQVGVAMACVLVPCFFMGVTFPLLCHAFLGRPGDARGARLPSALYAWNTLGAALGLLASQFWLLPWIGHDLMFLALAAANLALGAFFLASGGAPAAPPARAPQRAARSDARPPEPAPRSVASRPEPGSSSPAVLLTCAVLSGLLAGALEGDLFKRVTFNAAGSSATLSMISFWAILGIFLASGAVRAIPALRLVHVKVAFVAALAYYLAAWELVHPLVDWFRERSAAELGGAGGPTARATPDWGFPSSLGQLLAFVGISGFVPYLLVSLLLPYVCNRLQGSRRHVGLAYGLNTVAFCIGLVGFTLVAPRVDVFYSLKLFLVLFAVGTGLLLAVSEGRRLAPWVPAAAAGVFALGCLVTPAGFDAGYVTPGSPAARFPVHSLRSNAAHTTYVVEVPGDRRLFFDNYSMSGSSLVAQFYMRLMAHFPLLAQPEPRSALLICFGVGNTASAIAAHESVERIDVVDLNHQVFATAPEFEETHGGVHRDPRVRFFHADGRSFLRTTDATYDLITSEPPPPMHVGVYRLYSREYYEDALARLSPTGLMTQWLPVAQMPPEAVDLAIATFVEVFPNALLFSGLGTELVLMGGPAPIDLRVLEARFDASPRVRDDLAKLGIESPLSIVSRILMGDAALRQGWAGGRVLSDQHNDLEHLFLARLQGRVIPYDPLRVLEDVGAEQLAMYEELRGVVTHFGRLRHHAPGFPGDSLAAAPARDAVELSGLDWHRVDRSVAGARAAAAAGQPALAARSLRRALAVSDEQPALLLELANLRMAAGRHADAVAPLERLLEIEPRDARAHHRLAVARLGAGRSRDALAPLREAARLRPTWSQPVNQLAWILATDPDPRVRDPGQALGLARRAAELTEGRDPWVLDTLAAAYAADGQFDRAVATAEQALAVATELPAPRLARSLGERLALYRSRTAYRTGGVAPQRPPSG